jgi:tripartite-type tricarboxylate transporter receptor subunit TctC
MISTTAGAMGLLRQDTRLRAIAVTSPRRTPLLADVPTVAETLPGYESVTWAALAAPRGTPAPVLDRLHGAMAGIMDSGNLRQRLAELVEGEVGLSPRDATRGLVATEITRWRALIQARNLTAE